MMWVHTMHSFLDHCYHLLAHLELSYTILNGTFILGNTFYTVTFLSPVPPPPIGLKADNIKATSMTISWKSPHDVNYSIRGYQVSYTPHGESECLHDIAGNTTSTELTGLRPHTEYTIRVRAKTVDYGEYSIPITARTLEDGKCFILHLKNYK